MRHLPRIHAITNDEVLALPDFLDRAEQLTSNCDAAIHIRSGSLDGRRLTDIVESLSDRCGDATVFVNDRADVARATRAAGVHLPSAGLPVREVRAIVGAEPWIGRSTHNLEEVDRAAGEGADYVFIGPVWPTASHPGKEPLGAEVLGTRSTVRMIAIGGITTSRAAACSSSGAYGIAAISSIWYASNVASTARALSLSFQM